jgi:hypothetical protein
VARKMPRSKGIPIDVDSVIVIKIRNGKIYWKNNTMIQYKVIFLDSIDVALATERLAV